MVLQFRVYESYIFQKNVNLHGILSNFFNVGYVTKTCYYNCIFIHLKITHIYTSN